MDMYERFPQLERHGRFLEARNSHRIGSQDRAGKRIGYDRRDLVRISIGRETGGESLHTEYTERIASMGQVVDLKAVGARVEEVRRQTVTDVEVEAEAESLRVFRQVQTTSVASKKSSIPSLTNK